MKVTTPDATNKNWQLFLLGYVNEDVRKALLLNTLTKQILQAKVKITPELYSIIEAVDEKKNEFVKVNLSFQRIK